MTSTHKHDIASILKSLGLPPFSQKIYQSLLENGETTARFLSESLGITRPSTYDHLHILIKKGLVVEKKVGSTTYFLPDDVKYLKRSLEDAIDDLKEKKQLFETMLPSLLKEGRIEHPRISFFEGKEGIARVIYDVLWCSGKTIFTLWPYEEMLAVVGEDVLLRFNKRRLQEKITIHSVWPHESKDKDHIWKDDDSYTKRKKAPKGFNFSMGYTVYGDRVAFISSHNEGFGFIVQSRDFSDLMRLQFDLVWKASK